MDRLIEVVGNSGDMHWVVLAGHPKLKNDLRRSSVEEIASGATIFELESLGSEKPKYLKGCRTGCSKYNFIACVQRTLEH